MSKVPRTEANPEEVRERAVEALERNLKVTQSGRARIQANSYTAQDERGAARLANGIANAYRSHKAGEQLARRPRRGATVAASGF